MKIKIKEMYLEDITGKGQYILTLVSEENDEFQGEVEVHNMHEDIIFYKLATD